MNKIVLSEGTSQRVGIGGSRYGELKGMGLGDALVNIQLVAGDVTSRYRGRILQGSIWNELDNRWHIRFGYVFFFAKML